MVKRDQLMDVLSRATAIMGEMRALIKELRHMAGEVPECETGGT